ncbi:MAG: hypothetical protein ACK4SY_07090 [Pyrobaculum sp.]
MVEDRRYLSYRYLTSKYGSDFLQNIKDVNFLMFVVELLSQDAMLYIPKPDSYVVDPKTERIYIDYGCASLVVDIPRKAIYLAVANKDIPTPLIYKPIQKLEDIREIERQIAISKAAGDMEEEGEEEGEEGGGKEEG